MSDFNKIKHLVKEDIGPMLGFIFQNITLLLGIKEPIQEINKLDIKKMIVAHYGNLSMEEIVYAFELERYGKLLPKSEHYQLVNAEYVADVLGKYKKWLSKTRFDHNLPISKPKEQKQSISETEKQKILISGSLRCFEEFKELGYVAVGNKHIYEFLFDDLKIHQFSTKEKNASMSIALRRLKEQAKSPDSEKRRLVQLALANPKKSEQIKNIAKRLLLENYFNSLGNKHLKDILCIQKS